MAITIPAPGPNPAMLVFHQFVSHLREQDLREQGEPKESGAALSASGAMSGAASGMSFGPWGALAGGIIGGVAGPKRTKPGTGPYAQPGNIAQDDAAILQGAQNLGNAYTAYQNQQRAIEQDSLRMDLTRARLESLSPEGRSRTALNKFLSGIGSTPGQYAEFKKGLEGAAQASLSDDDVLELYVAQAGQEAQRAKIQQTQATTAAREQAQHVAAFNEDPNGFHFPNTSIRDKVKNLDDYMVKLIDNPGGIGRQPNLDAELQRVEAERAFWIAKGAKKVPPKPTGKEEWARIASLIDGTEDAFVLGPDGTGEVVHLTPRQKSNREQMAADEAGFLTEDRSIFRSVSGGQESLISTPGHAERAAKAKEENEKRRQADLSEALTLRKRAIEELRGTRRYSKQQGERLGETYLPDIPEGAILVRMDQLRGLGVAVPEHGPPLQMPLPGQQTRAPAAPPQPQGPPPPSPEQQAVASASSFLQAIAEQEGTGDPSKWSKAMRRKAIPHAEAVIQALTKQFPNVDDAPEEVVAELRRLLKIVKAK